MAEPTFSAKAYLLTYAALLCLTLSTVLIGYLNLGWGSMFLAVAFATFKATLIAAIFMHALLGSKLVKLVLAGAILWFLILVTLTLGDYITRGWLPIPGK